KMPNNFSLKHSTNMVKRFNVEEYAAPVDFKVKGFTQPIEIGSNSYFINVSFIKDDDNFDFFSYKIKTFLIDLFDENVVYNIGDKIYYNGKVWKKVMNGSPDDGIPEENNGNWEISSIDTLLNNQVISGYNYDGSDISFSIDTTVDPHFIVEVYWHSG